MRQTHHRGGRGLTLIELLVGLTIMAVLLSVALPAFSSWRETARLRGAAAALQSDLRLAQSEAQKRQSSMAVSFRSTSSGGWCYGWRLDTHCDCRQAQQCVIDGAERVVRSDDWPGIALVPGVSGGTFTFNPRRGTVTAGNVTLAGEYGGQLRVVVSGIGRIRQCTPNGSLAGVPACD